MSSTANLTLNSHPISNKFTNGRWVTINATGGQNFGNGPNVVFYDPMTKFAAGDLIQTNSPVIGTYTDITNNAFAVSQSGKLWMPSRDPSQISSTSENRVTAGFEAAPFSEFYWFHKTMTMTGKKFPFAAAPGQSPDWSTTNMKPWWATNPGNTDLVDQVLPSYNASGAGLFGNTNEVSRQIGYNFSYPGSNDLIVTAPTCWGYYQSGDEVINGNKDATINIQRHDANGFVEDTYLADPFSPKATIIGNNEYYRMQWMSMTNTPVGGWADVMMLTRCLYLAIGPNARATVFVGDTPLFSTCTDPEPVYALVWNNSQIIFDKQTLTGYVHVRLANGSVYNNILGVSI